MFKHTTLLSLGQILKGKDEWQIKVTEKGNNERQVPYKGAAYSAKPLKTPLVSS